MSWDIIQVERRFLVTIFSHSLSESIKIFLCWGPVRVLIFVELWIFAFPHYVFERLACLAMSSFNFDHRGDRLQVHARLLHFFAAILLDIADSLISKVRPNRWYRRKLFLHNCPARSDSELLTVHFFRFVPIAVQVCFYFHVRFFVLLLLLLLLQLLFIVTVTVTFDHSFEVILWYPPLRVYLPRVALYQLLRIKRLKRHCVGRFNLATDALVFGFGGYYGHFIGRFAHLAQIFAWLNCCCFLILKYSWRHLLSCELQTFVPRAVQPVLTFRIVKKVRTSKFLEIAPFLFSYDSLGHFLSILHH